MVVPATKTRKLTKKERFFVREYQKDWNGAQAVIRVGYRCKNNQNAAVLANQMLKKTLVRAAIDSEVEERLIQMGVRADRVLQEIARIGLSDVRRIYGADGRLKLPAEWDDETAAAVAGVETFEVFGGGDLLGYTKKVKLCDKVKALDLLGTHLKLFPNAAQRVDVDLNVRQDDQLNPLQLAAKIVYLIEMAKRQVGEPKQIKE